MAATQALAAKRMEIGSMDYSAGGSEAALASFWIASISGNTSVYGREPRYCRMAFTRLVESLISFMLVFQLVSQVL